MTSGVITMDSDETKVLRRTQNFAFNEYGTRVSATAPPNPVVTEAVEPTRRTEDPLVRIERILERAIESLESLERRVDSIETSIADFIRR